MPFSLAIRELRATNLIRTAFPGRASLEKEKKRLGGLREQSPYEALIMKQLNLLDQDRLRLTPDMKRVMLENAKQDEDIWKGPPTRVIGHHLSMYATYHEISLEVAGKWLYREMCKAQATETTNKPKAKSGKPGQNLGQTHTDTNHQPCLFM